MTAVDVVKVIAEECGKGFDAQRKQVERLAADREDMKELEEMEKRIEMAEKKKSVEGQK
jgi:hypothetical protein